MVRKKQSLFVVAVLVRAFALAVPPKDQGFWNFFKEGMKDDLTLIGLGMHAGLRVMIPGYAEIEDMIVNGYDTDTATEASYAINAAAADQLKDIVKDVNHPLNKRAKELLKARNIKPRNLTKASKRLSKFAGGLGWISTGLDTYSEIQTATLQAMEYQKSREAEYASTKTEKKQQKQLERKEEKHPCIPCWAGDLVGTCSDPKCPNYGNPHRTYKGGGLPAFGKR